MKLHFFFILSIAFVNANVIPTLPGEERDLECNFSFPPNIFDQLESLYSCNVLTGFGYTNAIVIDANGAHLGENTNLGVAALVIENVHFEILPSGIDAVFPNLRGLKVNGAGLKYLNRSFFRSLVGLTYLDLSGNEIRILETNLFRDNVNLVDIDLRDNDIMYISEHAFDLTSTRIQKFSIGALMCSGTEERTAESLNDAVALIDTLKTACSGVIWLERAFADRIDYFTTELESLDDKLRTIPAPSPCPDPEPCPTEASVTCPEITTVTTTTVEQCDTEDLENQITELNSNIEALSSNLASCNDEKSALETKNDELEEELFEEKNPVNSTCRLKETDDGYTCSGNRINYSGQIIEWFGDHLDKKSNDDVKVFLIKSQNVSSVPIEVGKTFTNLETFIIFNSGLQNLNKNDFVTLEKLKKLSLADNEISSIERGTFDILTELSYLDLSSNSLSVLPTKAFAVNLKLNYLNLNDNKLSQVRYELLPLTSIIKEFYVKNNRLSSVDSLFVWRLKGADVIEFTGNKCDDKFDRINGDVFGDFMNRIVVNCS